MTVIRSSATGSGTTAVNAAVSVGTPSAGDLVLVWLATSNEIVTHAPGWNETDQWSHAWQVRPSWMSGATLTLWYHTWNSADSGSPEFTFVPAPGLGLGGGDKDLSTTDYAWISAVVEQNSIVEWAPAQSADPLDTSVSCPPQKHPEGVTSFTAAFSVDPTAALSLSGGTPLQSVTGGPGSLAAWTESGSVGNVPRPTSSTSVGLSAGFLTVADAVGRFYNPPVVQEGPVAYDPLFFRYMLTRYYTVLETAGVFDAVRYTDTDAIDAADAVFVNNSPVTSSQVTAILAAGVGGDFRYLDR